MPEEMNFICNDEEIARVAWAMQRAAWHYHRPQTSTSCPDKTSAEHPPTVATRAASDHPGADNDDTKQGRREHAIQDVGSPLAPLKGGVIVVAARSAGLSATVHRVLHTPTHLK